MSFTRKIVGNLEFNQEEGEIKHTKTGERLAKFASIFANKIVFLNEKTTIAVDSTGSKILRGWNKIRSEQVKFAKKAVFRAYSESVSVSDCVVEVRLYDLDAGENIAVLTFSGESGSKEAEISVSNILARAGHKIMAVVEVTTASGTSGAVQTFNCIELDIIYDFT